MVKGNFPKNRKVLKIVCNGLWKASKNFLLIGFTSLTHSRTTVFALTYWKVNEWYHYTRAGVRISKDELVYLDQDQEQS